jgi:hypothetical protein
MLDELQRTLRKLERGTTITVSMPLDTDGYLDRRCPWSECQFLFKVLVEDWNTKVANELAYCPFCGHSAPAKEFVTPTQRQYLRDVVIGRLRRELGSAIRADAQTFNALNRPMDAGLISLSMRMDVSTPAVTMALPPKVLDAMTLRLICEACQCQSSVIGAAFFCPACGHNSADQTFSQSIASARASIGSLAVISAAILDRDAAAQTARMLTEGTLGSLVTAFQRFVEVLYPRLPKAATATPRRNAFQSLDEGSRLWETAGGRSYEKIVDAPPMTLLRRMFQQRHLLAHQEGMVDQEYVSRSGDLTYKIGQRLVVHGDTVLAFTDRLEELASGMKADVP